MLLLIFFLLTSSFIPQAGIQVNLPEADASAPVDDQYLTVTITAEGRFYVGEREVAREALEAEMTSEKGDRTALVLRADEQATVGQFSAVATVARSLDMRVLMATEAGTAEPPPAR